MLPELKGKTVLVTGASRGIGAACAVGLAEAGCERFLLQYNSHPDGVKETIRAVQAGGAKEALAFAADLSTNDGIHRAQAEINARGWPIDILVNNAGSLVQRAKLTEYTESLFDQVMNLNVKSAWFVAQTVARGMVERKSGCIINVSSIAARNGGGPGATIYAAAKAAVSTFTKGMSKELAPHGIRVNAVSPGTVDNHFHEVFSTRQMLDNVIAQTPAGRLSTNEDVSDVVTFLCSDAARYIHGQTIEINGGIFMV
jgi:3-oxoacyl-[acyl-carrier protein] reductase